MKGKIDEYRPGRWRYRFHWHGKTWPLYTMEVRGEWIPLTSKEIAEFLQRVISKESDNPGFDIKDYRRSHDKTFWFAHAIDKWIDGATCDIVTIQRRERHAEKLFKPYFKNLDIRQITTTHINNFHTWVKSIVCKTGKPYSDKTLENIFIELKGCFHYHADSLNKMPQFPKITVQDKEIYWLTEEEQDQVWEFIPIEHHPIFTFQKYTACRPNEARGLLKENVYRKEGYFIMKNVYGPTGLKPNVKNKRIKPLEIIPELEDALKPRDASRFVFTIKGEPYSKRQHEEIWRKAMLQAHEKYGIKIVSMYHGTKHSFGCNRLNEGFGKDEIRAVMGISEQMLKRYLKYRTHTLSPVMRGRVVEMTKKVEGR